MTHQVTEPFTVKDVQFVVGFIFKITVVFEVDKNGEPIHLFAKLMDKTKFDGAEVKISRPLGSGKDNQHIFVSGIISTERYSREKGMRNFERFEDEEE